MIQITKNHLEHMLVPELHWKCTLEEIPNECPQKEHLIKYIENFKYNLGCGLGMIFWGDYSNGKSGAAVILLKIAAINGKTGLFIKASKIPGMIIEKHKFDETTSMYERIQEVDLLVIDEIILRGDDRYTDTIAEEIIRDRVSNQKSTIITTNYSPAKINDKYPALAAVMKEAMVPVKFRGKDFREEQKEKIESEWT